MVNSLAKVDHFHPPRSPACFYSEVRPDASDAPARVAHQELTMQTPTGDLSVIQRLGWWMMPVVYPLAAAWQPDASREGWRMSEAASGIMSSDEPLLPWVG